MKHLAAILLVPALFAAEHASLRPAEWSVVGGARPRTVSAGSTAAVVIKADIAKGWHIYSLTQKPGGPIPLRLKLVGAADVEIHGAVRAPNPERTFDKNFGIETEVYSGSPRFTMHVGVPGNSILGLRDFQVEVRYQVCSDKLCLPVRTEKLQVALMIRRGK